MTMANGEDDETAIGLLVDLSEVPETPKRDMIRRPIFDSLDSASDLSKTTENDQLDGIQIEAGPVCAVEEEDKLSLLSKKKQKASHDFKLIEDEMFDFDFLSPNNSVAAEDDEVFFGPVKYAETLTAAAIELYAPVHKTMSPLTAAQFSEVVKEAHTVAFHLSKTSNSEKSIKMTSLEKADDKNKDEVTTCPLSSLSPPPASSPDKERRKLKLSNTEQKVQHIPDSSDVHETRSNTDSKLKKFGTLKRSKISASTGSAPKRSLKDSFNKMPSTPVQSSFVRPSQSLSAISTSGTNGKVQNQFRAPFSKQKLPSAPSPGRLMRIKKAPTASNSESSLVENALQKPRSSSLKKPSEPKYGIKKCLNTGALSRLQSTSSRSLQKDPTPVVSQHGPVKALPQPNFEVFMQCELSRMRASGSRDRELSGSSSSSVSSIASVGSVGSVTTPVKIENRLQPRKILGSSSICDKQSSSSRNKIPLPPSTPVSESKKKSFLPTPGRHSSSDAIKKLSGPGSKSASVSSVESESSFLRRPSSPCVSVSESSFLRRPSSPCVTSLRTVFSSPRRNSNKENAESTTKEQTKKPSRLATLQRKPSIKR